MKIKKLAVDYNKVENIKKKSLSILMDTQIETHTYTKTKYIKYYNTQKTDKRNE